MAYTPESAFTFDANTKTITDFAGGYDTISIPPTIGGVTVLHIGNNAFYQKNLFDVTFPNTITTIGISAFEGNNIGTFSNFVLTIPEGITYIDNYAFRDNAIGTLILPNSLTETKIESFACYWTESHYNGTIYYPLTSVTLGNAITKIGKRSFFPGLYTSINLPSTLTYLDDCAFQWSALTSIHLPWSLTHIGAQAFEGCSLDTVNIPPYVNYIGSYAFAGNTNFGVQPIVYKMNRFCISGDNFLIFDSLI